MRPGAGWRWIRRGFQVPAFVALLLAPLLGGWQRMDRNYLSAWRDHGWDLPPRVLESLPLGEMPRKAYEANQIMGGGSAGDYFNIAAIDPVGGLLAMLSSTEIYVAVIVAWLIPILLALFLGRFFCGWMCPFGSLARGLSGLLDRLPWRIPSFVPPRVRLLRFGLLAIALLLGAMGTQMLLYLLLPHLLFQQSIYAMWLMGGGGAAFGALLALVMVGVFFGPTVYCATVCPTGAALSLIGRRRVVRLQIIDKPTCGAHCDLCDRACWLFLHPSEGEPGADCDNCTRCTEVCPSDNLEVVLRAPWKKWNSWKRWKKPAKSVAPILLGLWLGGATVAQAAPGRPANDVTIVDDAPLDKHKAALLLDARRRVDGTDIAISVLDISGVRLDADDLSVLEGLEISVYVVRGPRGEPDKRGRLPAREFYQGPLSLRVQGVDGVDEEIVFTGPSDPHSTPNRSIYRKHIDGSLRPGDTVTLGSIEGWVGEDQTWDLPAHNAGRGALRMLAFVGVGFLLFGGVTALALGFRLREPSDEQESK